MLNDVDLLIKKMFAQAKNGVVKIGDNNSREWRFFVKFLTRIEGKLNDENNNKGVPVCDIPDYDLFVKKITEYLSIAKEFYKNDREYYDIGERSFEEKLFIDLMVNSSFNQMNNIYEFIDFRTNMLKNNVLEGEFCLGSFNDCLVKCKIDKNRSNLEAPYNFSLRFTKGVENEFLLPKITFGIIDDKVYVYAVQAKKDKQNSSCAKFLDRYFRKLNKGVEEGSLESQVSPNALASFTIFNAFVRKNGFKYIYAYDILPLRYESGIKVDQAKHKFVTDEELLDKHNHDQFNITNRLMYLFLRYGFHFGEENVTYDDNLGQIELLLNGNTEKGDNIIFELDKFVDISEYSKNTSGLEML